MAKTPEAKTSSDTMPSPVTVLVTQDVSDPVKQALTEAGAQVLTLENCPVESLLMTAPGPVGLVWDGPARLVAGALLAAADPVDAVTGWLDRHRLLLSLIRRHRRRLRVVDARILDEGHSEADRSRLSAWLGLAAISAPEATGMSDATALACLLASRSIPRIAELRACLDELESSSLTNVHDLVSLADAGNLFAGSEHLPRLVQEIEEARALRNRAEEWQLELDARARRITVLEDEVSALREQAAQQAEAQALKEEQRRNLGQEAERNLARALSDLREEARQRKALQERLEQAEARVRELQDERDQLGHTLDTVYRSRSWRITRPLRREGQPHG